MPETYPGKILITRPMNQRGDRTIQVEVERATSHYVIQAEVSEAEVARMLLGSSQVPCMVTDYTADVATHLERKRWVADVTDKWMDAKHHDENAKAAGHADSPWSVVAFCLMGILERMQKE